MHHMNQCISMSVLRNVAIKGENEGGERNLVENEALKRDEGRGHTCHT